MRLHQAPGRISSRVSPEIRLDSTLTASSAPQAFVEWFRAATPYIHAFRGRTFVVACGGEVIAEGTPEDVVKVERSYTGQFLKDLLERRPMRRVAAE